VIQIFNDINQAQLNLLKRILLDGKGVQTRDQYTLEVAPVYFQLTNPLNRITLLKGRNWNFAAALGELVWHLSGSNDVQFISNYLKQWKNFSEDGNCILGSCYGYKIFSRKNNEKNKWEKLISLFNQDIHTRRAVISLFDDERMAAQALDVSCTCSLQFLVRNDQLDLIVHMRSNDVIWGLPYDIFFFTFLQELMSIALNVKVGIYHHFVASMHLYQRHFKLAQDILDKNFQSEIRPGTMLEISNPHELEHFIQLEKKLRKKEISIHDLNKLNIHSYWKSLLFVIAERNTEKFAARLTPMSSLKHLP
jgi:thymidylate synthase